MDLDFFKTVNDNYGHDHGDIVLKEFSRLLTKHFSQHCISRFGGEEFCVFLPNVCQKQAIPLLDDFRVAVSKKRFIRKGVAVNCSVSIGVTSKFKRQVESMLSYADGNLYKAKDRGRNCIVGDEWTMAQKSIFISSHNLTPSMPITKAIFVSRIETQNTQIQYTE